MANVIKRIVQLVLDKNSAKATEDDAKKALGGVEGSLGKLKAAALAVGAAILGALAVRKVLDFGAASVRVAQESEGVWSNLASTIDATGESFAGMEADVNAASKAFQAATKYGDEDYASTLARLVTLTGDVSASTQNMGLVANVAARFFDGDLAPAADLVAKVMNGNVNQLQRMGIAVGSAQEGLEVLAQRSMGAAEAAANTMAGRVESLNQLWGDFQEAVGFAIMGADDTGDALGIVGEVVADLTGWVEDNREALNRWVGGGISVVIHALDGTWRVLKSVAQAASGIFLGSISLAAKGTALFAGAIAAAVEGASKLPRLFGATGTADAMEAFAGRVRNITKAVNDFAETSRQAGLGLLVDAVDTFSTSSVGDGAGGRSRPRLQTNAPRTSRNARGGRSEGGENAGKETAERAREVKVEVDRATAAIEAFNEAGERNRTLSTLMGDDFNFLQAEANRLQTVMAALASEGVGADDAAMQMFAERLREVQAEMGALNEVTVEQTELMEWQTATAGALAGAIGAAFGGQLGPFAMGKAKTHALEAAEMGLRAGLALLNPFTAPLAGGYAAGAAKHAALGIAWAGLAATFGSSGAATAGVSASVPRSAGSGGASVSTARESSSRSASRAQAPAPQIAVHFVGPGFDMLNPEVQKVVLGAAELGSKRYGSHVKVVRAGG